MKIQISTNIEFSLMNNTFDYVSVYIWFLCIFQNVIFFDYRVVKILWHHQHRVQFIYAVMTKNGQTEGTDTVEKGLQQLTSQSNTAYFVCFVFTNRQAKFTKSLSLGCETVHC